ncbi:hypothetical protein D3C75_1386150 [compost metagenome]
MQVLIPLIRQVISSLAHRFLHGMHNGFIALNAQNIEAFDGVDHIIPLEVFLQIVN